MTTRIAQKIYEEARPVPKGRCKECGQEYNSWAFVEEDCQPEALICPKCDGEIELVEPEEEG